MSAKRGVNRKVRYAVVGLGHISQVAVLPAFKSAKNSELVALVTGDPAKQKSLSKKYCVERVYTYDQYDECLSQGVDAVYLAVPNHLHREYAVRAAKAGVHILCEKPMAVTEKECKEMIAAAEKNRVKLMVAYRLHFDEANLEAIKLAGNGKLGEVRVFSSDFSQQVPKGNIRVSERTSRGGGPVYDMGVYCINATRYLLRSDPVEVLATIANNGEARFRNTEEMASVIMRFPNDQLAHFTCSFGAADMSRYTLVGTKGILTADPAYDYAAPLKHAITVNGKTKTRTFPKRDQFAAEIFYFSDCILNNRQAEPSGLEGLADVRIVEAIYRSAKSGKAVKLGRFAQKRRPNPGQQIHRPAHGKPETVNAQSPS
jgi:glucose-fructose oxidoreductase